MVLRGNRYGSCPDGTIPLRGGGGVGVTNPHIAPLYGALQPS